MLVRAIGELQEGGLVQVFERTGNAQVSPWYAIRNKAAEQVYRYGGALGLSPSERSRMSITGASKDGVSDLEKNLGYKIG